MHLTFREKGRVFFSSPHGWGGSLFLVLGLFFLVQCLPALDFRSLLFAVSTIQQTQGYITHLEETHYGDGDIPIQAIDFRYSLDGREWTGRSFSSELKAGLGDTARVEYITYHPELARITGTTSAPLNFWPLVPIIVALTIGAKTALKSLVFTRKVTAIVGDGFATLAICERTTRKEKQGDGDVYQVYETQYTYSFNGREYLHVVENPQPRQIGAKETIILEQSGPSNAVLLDNLPKVIRQKLLL